jgi:hypothetical protein
VLGVAVLLDLVEVLEVDLRVQQHVTPQSLLCVE